MTSLLLLLGLASLTTGQQISPFRHLDPIPGSPNVPRTPHCPSPFAWIRDPQDCTHFWRCVWGRAVEMPRCPSRLVLSSKLNVCVFPGSVWDDCNVRPQTTQSPATPNPPPMSIADRCARGEQLIPHPEHCQLYYNCSLLYRSVPRYFQQYLAECPHPRLFDSATLACRDFQEPGLQCGGRKVPVDACEYRRFWCPVSHCIPCKVANPSCKGLPDGLNVRPGRKWTPQYMVCRAGRTDRTAECPWDPNFRVPQIFHPERRECVNLFWVPREEGGLLPSCEGIFDGAYPVPEKTEGVSFICRTGRLVNLRYCPTGSSPRPEPRTCIYS